MEYDGAPFVGWQRQANGPSVQGALEDAVKAFCGEETTAFAAGRTDAGVHALAMTAHVDVARAVDAWKFREAVNHHLKPAPIAILDASVATGDFHARFSATARRYLYRIVNRRAPLALDAGRAWRVGPALDAEAMHAAAQTLVGKHDFTTFRAAQCQAASPVKTVTAIACARRGDEIEIVAIAPSFLHNQVRSIAGTLVEAGLGKRSARDVADALAAADRRACGQVAPACGLYFLKADYDEAASADGGPNAAPSAGADA